MNTFIFTKKSEKLFKKLSIINQERIINKLSFLKDVEDISIFLNPLENMLPATHRLRVWSLRLILEKDSKKSNIFYIIDLGNRWEIYK